MTRLRTTVVCAATLALLASPVGASAAPPPGRGPGIEVLSSPGPDLVTGGDALVRIGSAGATVWVGHRDITGAFAAQPDGSLLGLVTGLPVGPSTIVTRGPQGGSALTVVNHPITGPVFSGPQQLPFFCETQAFGLMPASQPFCAAPTVVSYLYRTTAGRFAPLPDPASRPSDLAETTVDGRQVPYVVRVERGTIDRAVYEIAALYDGSDPSPLRTSDAWNRRLVYTFGGGCNVGYHQGASTGGVVQNLFLSQGYAVASSSLNVLDNNCNPVISAEAAMMVKEHFIEAYGAPAHTIGWGGSGGAIQQYEIADNYPGILDGIIPQVSFPDPTTVGDPVGDCRLLKHYFTTRGAGAGFTLAQQTAVSGFGTWGSCVNWDLSFAGRGNATEACPSAIPPAYRYDPATNPDGIKCTTAEQLVNQLGRDPRTGFARSYLDNVGVQYGLSALRSGQITAEQFVDLNEHLGGFDVAGDVAGQRSAADPLAVQRAYRSGLALSGSGGLRDTPVVDLRVYTDPLSDIHTRFWSFATRQRLDNPNSQVMLVYSLAPSTANPQAYALDAMDRWLTSAQRPADLVDGCWTPTGQRVTEPATWHGPGTCNTLYPSYADTRIAAGGPLRDDILKCQLKPFDPNDYPVAFTGDQIARLGTAFPHGVCDYSRPGMLQVPLGGVWRTY